MATTKNFVFDLAQWTMREFREWAKLIQEEEPNYERMAELASKVILSWPYDNDTEDVDTWENINVEQWATTLNGLKKSVEGLFAEGK